MGCEKIMNRFLATDGKRDLHSDITDHIAGCPRCLREVRNFEKAVALLSRSLERSPVAEDLSAAVLARIENWDIHIDEKPAASEGVEKKVSLRKWTITGLIMLLGMVLTPFSTILADLSAMKGPDFEVYLHLILGLILSVYTGVFIVSHQDFLRDYFRLPNAGLPK
jgi:hypothetical protein